MLPRYLKSAYFQLMRAPLQLSGAFYKQFRAPVSGNKDLVRVQLGPGQEKYKVGWINVDANIVSARADVWADLRNGLPFRDNSVDAFYSHHVIEHLPDASLTKHMSELYRCLKPGGAIRIGAPNGDAAARNFSAGNLEWFRNYANFPLRRESIGGQLVNFLLCNGEHLTIISQSYMRELLVDSGFSDLHFFSPRDNGGFQNLFHDVISDEFEEFPSDPQTLIVEATK